MSDIVPITIVSGFLGSGKTTVLNRALSGDHGKKIAVLVNEIGEIGLDASLIEGGESFVELDNGCLCCALNEDLVITLAEIGKRDDLDQVLIETTGIADPLPIGHSVTRTELGGRYRLDALVSTVDALNVEAALASDEGSQQIRRADVLLITKLDLVDEAREKIVRDRLTAENPHARVMEASDPAALTMLLDAGLDGASLLSAGGGDEAGHRHDDGHAHGDHGHDHDHADGHDHDHDGHHHPPRHGFDTVAVQVGDRPTIRFAFEQFLEELPKEVYRSKGIVRIDGERGRLVFHTVGGRVDLWHEPERSDAGVLVFIGRGLSTQALRDEVLDLFGLSEALT